MFQKTTNSTSVIHITDQQLFPNLDPGRPQFPYPNLNPGQAIGIPTGWQPVGDVFPVGPAYVEPLYEPVGTAVPNDDWLKALQTLAVLPKPAWRVSRTDARITACCDLPGVRPDDVSASLVAGVLHVVGRRADTGEAVMLQQSLGHDIDASSASATLEHGVLTVVVDLVRDRTSGKVPVNRR